MITIEKNKVKLNLIYESTPVANILSKNYSDKAHKLIMSFVSWTHAYPNVDINKLSSKTKQFSKIIGSPALGVKVLGSESLKNHIWILNVDSRPYIFYISLNGLSIETLPIDRSEQVIEDLIKIKKHLGLKETL